MRRLVLVLAALALLAPSSAGAGTPQSRVVVESGSVHLAGRKLHGTVVLANLGRAPAPHSVLDVEIGQNHPGPGVGAVWRVQYLGFDRIEPSAKLHVRFTHLAPEELRPGRWPVQVCVGTSGCRRIAWISIGGGPAPAPSPSQPRPSPARSAPNPSAPPGTETPAPPTNDVPPPPTVPADPTPPASEPPTPTPPISTVPTDPIPYSAGEPFEITGGTVSYWAFVPNSYDVSNLTPAPLLVWLHGCGGYSEGDIWVVDPGAAEEPQDWLTIALGGREGGCWTPRVDEAKVMEALADVETHFNVDRGQVTLGGYSSGGDLAYRTGFRHSSAFARLLIENSSPFRDTESSAAESFAAATTKLPIVHLAHTGDTTYPIAGVRQEVAKVAAAGFPIELIERAGTHYDGHTDSDLRELLLPHIDDAPLG